MWDAGKFDIVLGIKMHFNYCSQTLDKPVCQEFSSTKSARFTAYHAWPRYCWHNGNVRLSFILFTFPLVVQTQQVMLVSLWIWIWWWWWYVKEFPANIKETLNICWRELIFFICSDDIREIREKRMQSKFHSVLLNRKYCQEKQLARYYFKIQCLV